jgi:hypothetical protein
MNQKSNRIRHILSLFILAVLMGGISSCEKYSYEPPAVDPNTTWHFKTDIQPIFTANCASCHGGTQIPDLRDGKSYLALTKGSYVTLPAADSKLYKKMVSSSHEARSSATDKLKVLYWITQGALNN